ncbi:glucosylceramide transporter ABCA12 [Triplophysa dalaica]|uniref:glucosylceramide transporter ABCA12 n=1 Tax=Triplophysa dalaica TaxID=1582913 RepID=UPI0024DFE62C|nr:glucosylceramide transporter ABCA12 [Triplophysa dalaica]
MSNAEAGNITQETIKQVDEVFNALLPVEVNAVFGPITKSILTYLQSISVPGGPDKWNQVILDVMTDLQNSLSSNSPAQPIISMLLNITQFILSSDKVNLTGNLIDTQQLTGLFNETISLPLDVVDNILVGYYGLLQLITNPNMSYAEAGNLTVETIQMVDDVIRTLWSVDTAEVLVPVTNTIIILSSSISKPGEPDNWNEIILNLMKELQNSLPTNNTPQSIISMFLKVAESILSSSERNFPSNQDISNIAENVTHIMGQLIQSLLSPEEMASVTVSEQVLQHLNHALEVAMSDGGLQNEKFTKSIVSAIGVVLERMSNETGRLPQDGIDNILGAFHGSLQLILNPNMSNSQAGNITQEIIKQVDEIVHALLPAEATEVLGPITNSILIYWQTISQPGGPDKWNEVILSVMTDLQHSVSSNSPAQPIISMLLNITKSILSSDKVNMTEDWIDTQQLTSSFNGTVALPQDVVDNVLVGYYGVLQLITNPNLSYTEASNLTIKTIQTVDEVIQALWPVETTEVLVPITNSIITFLNSMSKPVGPDNWNEIILDVMEELVISLPSNNTAQSIISMFLKVTEFILNSSEGNFTSSWTDQLDVGNFADNVASTIDLEQLIQNLLSPEEMAFFAISEQVVKHLNHALEVASTDGDLQSEKFAEAIVSAVSVVLEGVQNETGPLSQDGTHSILGAFHGSLQLILNPNMSNAQAANITQEIVQRVDEVIHVLLPEEVTEVLAPITTGILSYFKTISQPGGPDKFNEVIVNVMRVLQNSLPSNGTAQFILSSVLKVTERILSPQQGPVNPWEYFGDFSLDNLNKLTAQLTEYMSSVSPFLNESSHMVTQAAAVLVQIISGNADEMTFDKLEEMLAAFLPTFSETALWESLPSVVSTMQTIIVNSTQNIQAQTAFFYSLQEPLQSLLSDIFDGVNASSFNTMNIVGGLPQALLLTAEFAGQAVFEGNGLNCSYVLEIWKDVGNVAGISENDVVLWCNVHLQPVTVAFSTPELVTTAYNITEMDPLWANKTADMMVELLETFYGVALNYTFAGEQLMENLLNYTSTLSNLSVPELTNLANWNAQLYQTQLQQSMSQLQMALDQIGDEHPGMMPYINAIQETIHHTFQNSLLQNSTSDSEIIMQALEIALTGMNFTEESINYFLSGDMFMNPNGSIIDNIINDVIKQVISMELLGDSPMLYGIMQQFVNFDNTSGILWKMIELVNWMSFTEETGINFVIEGLPKLYQIVRQILPSVTTMTSPLQCFADTFIDIAGNVLYLLRQIKQTSELFDPVEHYLNPFQMQLSQRQNLHEQLSHTRNTRRRTGTREPVDDFLDLLDIDYQALLQILSIPLTTTEILETMHVFFANPDLAVILKGFSGVGHEETIDTSLNVLSYLTLPNNGEELLEMFMDINNEGWNLENLHKIEKLAQSLGKTVDVAMGLSDQPSLNISQRIEHVAGQLQASVTNMVLNEGNVTSAVHFLSALNTILSENFKEVNDVSPQVASSLQNILGPFSSPESQMSVEAYLTAVDQTAEAFSPLLSGDEAMYFNISRQMLKAFALLEVYPKDQNEVLHATSLISDSLNHLLNLSKITTIPTGQSVEEITHPLILNSALATQILFNLSMSNYSLSNNAEMEWQLNQIFNQMSADLPMESHVYLHSVKSALFSALSIVSNATEIIPKFPQISKEVTDSLLSSLNITYDPMSEEMSPVDLAYILTTVSNQVSVNLFEGLMANDYTIQISQVVNSSSEALLNLYPIMPLDGQPYLNMTIHLMETMTSVVNDSNSVEDVDGAVSLIVNTINSLLSIVPQVNTNSTDNIMVNLEQTLKVVLMILQMDQNPLAQTADITQQLMHTIQNLLPQGNGSMEFNLAELVLGAANISIEHLQMMNDTNWTNKVPLMLSDLADALPDDLQYASFIKTVMRSLANESQENLHLLQEVLNTLFEVGSANWMNESSGLILDRLLAQVCALEDMSSVKLISQSLSLDHKLLCTLAIPTIQVIRQLTLGAVTESISIYDLIFQTFVGDLSTYHTALDWTSTISQIVGFDISMLKNLSINMPAPAEVEVSELLENTTLFVEDVMRYTSFPPEYLKALLESPLPSSNLQILKYLEDLKQCSNPSSLGLSPQGQAVFSAFCDLPVNEWYTMTLLLVRHVDMKSAIFRLVVSKEIQDLVGVMLEMINFLTEMMSKLSPALKKLQEYLTTIEDLNLVANKEFHGLVRGKRSTISSKATLSTISRALCKNGILTLFAISKLPIAADTDPSVQEVHRREELIEKFKIPHDASPFCMNLYLDMVNTTGGAVAWAFLKPMLLGQVLYSPDTPLTREIIKKSNSTLNQFGDLKLYSAEWLKSSSYVMQSANVLAKTLPILQNSLRNPFVQNFIQTQTGIDVTQMSATLSQFSNMTVLLDQNKLIMDQITTLSNLMMNLSSCVNFDRYKGFNSSDELDIRAEKLAQNRELYASVIFKLPKEKSNSSLPPEIDYTIRMNIENSMRTDRARNPFWVKDAFISAMNTQRYSRGFVYLQESIERAIIEMQTGKAIDGPAVQIQAFPYPCYYKDEYLNSIAFVFPMALMISWVLFIANFVKKLVHERELRLHEYMKMMGVNPISHFFAWFIESAGFLVVTITILTIILKAGGILPYSDGFVIFLYLCDYGLSILAISFLVSSFFDKTNIAGLSGSLIYVISFFPFIVLIHLEDNLSFPVKSALGLFSPTCFSYGSQYITRYEKQEEGIQWSNMYISPLAGDTTSFGWLCWLLLIDSGLYFIIGIYIRMVFPGKYGIGVPWYFPFTRSYWTDMFSCCIRSPKKIGRGLLFTNMMQEHNNRDKSKGTNTFLANGEEDLSRLPVGVSLHSLTKTYGNRHAVDNLNLSFYEGHVTSLLGHNGAGKTTTMSLLTGLFAPTSGTIEVYGMDMETYIEDVRKEMGVCMQYDVLFDHLTTKEHLLLYAQIKAPQWNKQEVKDQVCRILKETDMYSHRHKRVGTLSGGMKRKLSISIAFIGGSRLVVLDEPTTGVDPCSRRSIWDIVLQHKQERTIILSTHHLDEAEVLSDRIAFLELGGLKCCGSPFYLKDKLAKGYNLILTKKVQCPDSTEKFDSEELKQFIQSHLPDARPKEVDVGDVVYSLPQYSPQNAVAYQSLLNGLDQNLDRLQLGCYGISDTTLEEVFLELTQDNMEPDVNSLPSVSESVLVNDLFASSDSIADDINSMYLGEKASLTGSSSMSGLALTAQRVMAMLLKRVHHSKRDWKGLISQVVLPVLFVVAAMGLGSIKSDLQHFPKMELTPALYHVDEQYAFFSNQNSSSSRLVDNMMSYPGIDHFCMKNPSNPVCLERHDKGAETWISRGNNSAKFSTCKCSEQTQSCPASGYDPPHIRNPSSQIVYNLTGINIETYLLSTANDFIRNRYGGWEFGKPLPIDLKLDMLDVPQNRTLSKVWYNPEGHHSMPAYLNSLNNYLLRSSLPPEKRQQYAISVSSHPYPGQVQGEDIMVGSLVSILVSLCVITGYSIMTASFVIYEVQEHHTGSKRLQQISGISEHFYWIINFFYDMALYMVPVVLSVATVAVFQLSAFTDRQNLAAVTLLLVLFGFATFPWMYLLSAVFKDTEMAFIGYVCINLFISVNTIISTSILFFLGQLDPNELNVQDVYRTMSNLFLVFPQFSFGNGLMELARVDMQVQILNAYGVDAYKNPFSMDVLGWMYISLFLQGVICFTLRLLLNKSLIRKVRRLICRKKIVAQSYNPNDDEDVTAERLRVNSGAASADILQVNQLSKIYQHLKRRVHAVNGLSVGIPAGECFGLLGVNGAGKTTTFKMLTGDISPTDGSAKICNIDGRMVDIMDCRREGINIGYCPQVDALDDLLTGEEHLYFYARIRGISKREIDRVVNYLLQKMELNYHRQNTSESYSCGTRRKLSTALALIGNPQILLLDEPSSGMDPRTKRHLWRIIQEQVMGKCAVVLTSHSMEECEALCTRLAIMVKGQFTCLGSLQHIKNRFGKGFTVKMYLAGASCDVDMISNFMQQNFPSVYLKDHHSNMVEYHVPVAPGGVASIFNQLESNKAALQIQHFSVSQTTLDEVFINFAEGKMDADSQEVTDGSDVDSLDSYNALDT